MIAHHGSMAKERRLAAEQRLKRGELKALVATASLELGIDIGDVNLVCQIGSPRSIATFLQRVGRSGHAIGGTPKGRLFPLSRDDLVECAALVDSVRRGELDRLTIPRARSMCSHNRSSRKSRRRTGRRLSFTSGSSAAGRSARSRKDFDAIVHMLGEGFATRRGRRGALVHHDAVNGMLRGRRGARTTALTSGGTIPDTADYQVLLEPENQAIGTVNEDFAVESMAGDIFQLGNASYRIQRVERGTVRVEDAKGMAPNIPFWLGEAPGRADALSASVSRLRADVAPRLRADASGSERAGLAHRAGRRSQRRRRSTRRLSRRSVAALGAMPTQDTIVIERFFDEAGGMQLVIHSPFGSRLNRAWGLALRKRFCRTFNFELQAAATEDNISVADNGAQFRAWRRRALSAFEQRARRARAGDAQFAHVHDALALGGGRFARPAALSHGQESAAAVPAHAGGGLVAAVFPDQIACAKKIVGEREIPDHPLTNQAIDDCLHEAMDIDGLERLLRRSRRARSRSSAAT